jgi:hypothetical protein
MTNSNSSLCSVGASISSRAPQNSQVSASNLVGWLIQTAVISVVEGTCETFTGSRGSVGGSRSATAATLLSPLKFLLRITIAQGLISSTLGQKSKLFSTGYVAGRRLRRRAVPGKY